MKTYRPDHTAKAWAFYYHNWQKYGELDYTYHLQSVVNKCSTLYGWSMTNEAICWLHDVLEDTDCTYDDLLETFGLEIASAVSLLTKNIYVDYSYESYIAQLKQNTLARQVKIADTLVNLEESVKIGDVKRIKKYSKQLQLLVEVCNEYGCD